MTHLLFPLAEAFTTSSRLLYHLEYYDLCAVVGEPFSVSGFYYF
jgi:hypothetical protein